MTPYIADTYHEWGVYFASHGMPFLIVDVRGRGNSEGVFQPFIQEATDGYDVVEWLAHQPYCNAKVAMWGGSYAGYNQWVTAAEFPPHLATIAPVASPYIGHDFPMRNNIFYPYVMQWLTYTGGRASQAIIFSDVGFWSGIFLRWCQSGNAFHDLDKGLETPSPIFQEWLAHPDLGPYWDNYNPGAADYADLRLPILTITGSYDDDQPGALEHYREHRAYGSEMALERHYLVIGPWDHAGTRSPKQEFGGLKVGPASLVDLRKLHLDWYAWTMQSGPKPEFLKKQVAYYVMGEEQWRYADSLDQITSHHEINFLNSEGAQHGLSTRGSLQDSPGQNMPDSYAYDPAAIDAPELAAEATTTGSSLVDQQVTLALKGRQFIYDSEPLQEDVEVSGFFRLAAWISIDTPDTDLYASVHEIDPDGASLRLSTDAIRARYRVSRKAPMPVQTRDPLLYDFRQFTFVSRVLKRGHRLRLIIAPLGRIIEGTFWERNYNSGGVVARETANDARAVTVRLFHDDDHPSALFVPIGKSVSRPLGGT